MMGSKAFYTLIQPQCQLRYDIRYQTLLHILPPIKDTHVLFDSNTPGILLQWHPILGIIQNGTVQPRHLICSASCLTLLDNSHSTTHTDSNTLLSTEPFKASHQTTHWLPGISPCWTNPHTFLTCVLRSGYWMSPTESHIKCCLSGHIGHSLVIYQNTLVVIGSTWQTHNLEAHITLQLPQMHF